MKDTLREDHYRFLITSRSVLLRMRKFSDKVVEKMKTYILYSISFRKSQCLLGNIENIVEPGRPQMTIWPIRVAGDINKAAHTLSQYVIFITFHCKNVCKYACQYYVVRTYTACLL